ncbi:MAG: hypothetical protein ABR606_13470 [Vicinamibacterales bacterium]
MSPLSIRALLLLACAVLGSEARGSGETPVRGLTAGDRVAGAYHAVLDADDDRLPAVIAETCPPAPGEACLMLDALATWWQILLDPESRTLDDTFLLEVDAAVAAAEAWTVREPERAEAFFYLGAASGARAQWRVLRGERLAAAREGKRIKEALERALVLDPTLSDAHFGIGLYRYYAGVAPAGLRMLRWLFLLPGGDRQGGLAQIAEARERGTLIRGEADYQLHLIYLWYEKRFAEAARLIEGLQARHPRNPLFFVAEAEIADIYLHEPTSALRAAEDLLARSEAGVMNARPLAEAQAHFLMTGYLDQLSETDRALTHAQWVVSRAPAQPLGIAARASVLAARLRARLAREPYRLGLEGWRALEGGNLDVAMDRLARSVALDPSDAVARYRYALVLIARDELTAARAELERTVSGPTTPPVTRCAAHVALARLLADRGDRAGALQHYEAAAQVFGADPRVKREAAREAERLRHHLH